MTSGYYIGQHIFRSLKMKMKINLGDNRNRKGTGRSKKIRKVEENEKERGDLPNSLREIIEVNKLTCTQKHIYMIM